MTSAIRARQLPGRQEALRLALGKPATPLLKHIAGLDKVFKPQSSDAMPQTFRLKNLHNDEREAFDF